VEHIVQDGGTKGFAEFAQKMEEKWPDRPGYRRVMVSEPDQGMYDAINRGLKRATGSICAYLNCDEQYLPGVLKTVLQRFKGSSDVDLFLGDVVVVDGEGKPICHRKMIRPSLAHTWTCHFGALTAGIFFRRKVIDQGLLFNTSYRAVADAEWFLRILKSGISIQPLRFDTSTFMEAGNNLGLSLRAKEERLLLNRSAPIWIRLLRPGWVIWHRARRWLRGCHRKTDVCLEIYISESSQRRKFTAKQLRTTWPGRITNF